MGDLHEPSSVSGMNTDIGVDIGVGSGTSSTDEDLINRFRRHDDNSAFESLLRRYLGNAEMAEDVFQATFLQIHLKKEQFEEGRRFRPWLYTIATNQAIDAQRRNKRHRMVSLDNRAGGQDDTGALVEMLSGREGTAVEKME